MWWILETYGYGQTVYHGPRPTWSSRVLSINGKTSTHICPYNTHKKITCLSINGDKSYSHNYGGSMSLDEIITEIEDRIATWTFLPIGNGEPIQVLRYEHGQKYEPHFDFFSDKYNLQFGGNRVATVLMYLSNVGKGGETVFPNTESSLLQLKDESLSECAKMGYAVKPIKGDALLFFSLRPNATVDIKSLHGSCPVIEGEKWSATKWIHASNFDIPFKKLRKIDVYKLVNV
ncbi:hypothetical protein Lal_00036938 [Lupinus albus]|nr:hypothetical protein Lal_00036938 [Lupinus albus]